MGPPCGVATIRRMDNGSRATPTGGREFRWEQCRGRVGRPLGPPIYPRRNPLLALGGLPPRMKPPRPRSDFADPVRVCACTCYRDWNELSNQSGFKSIARRDGHAAGAVRTGPLIPYLDLTSISFARSFSSE